MKKSDIKVKGKYTAKVSDKVVVVVVDNIRERSDYNGKKVTLYDVTNTSTGRRCTFMSAARFRAEVKPVPKVGDLVKVRGGEVVHRVEAVLPGSKARLSNGASAPLSELLIQEPPKTPEPHAPAVTPGGSVKRNQLTFAEMTEGEESRPPTPNGATAPTSSGNAASVTSSSATTSTAPPAAGPVSVLKSATGYATAPSAGSSALDSSPADRFAAMAARFTRAAVNDSTPHLVVKARAGTGKTTTLVQGIKAVLGLDPRWVSKPGGGEFQIDPMPQQAAVWEEMKRSAGKAKTICFAAYNTSIADELKRRVPRGAEACTMHSMGFRTVKNSFKLVKGNEVNKNRVDAIIGRIVGVDPYEYRRRNPIVMEAAKKLVSLCKVNLVGLSEMSDSDWYDKLDGMARHYEVDLYDDERDWTEEVFALVPAVLEACKAVNADGCIDFDDMIWIPLALNLPVFRYDMLMVDEGQDLNHAQQMFAKKAGERLIICGDDRQAIYAFAGADSESLPRLTSELGETSRGVVEVPLTVTRRCGKAIVEEARKIVPDFEAHESNGPGKISHAPFAGSTRPAAVGQATDEFMAANGVEPRREPESYRSRAEDGDMVLCRVNAPLVSECFRFIKEGRKANIQGRNIGQSLASLVTKLGATTVTELTKRLDEWYAMEVDKENAKRNPSDQRLITLSDKRECLNCFIEDTRTVPEVLTKIDSVFTEQPGSGIRLSSIHKAKGLEAKRVFFLRPFGAECPHPMAKSDWQYGQEKNLEYVATTRAIEELVHVA